LENGATNELKFEIAESFWNWFEIIFHFF